MKLWNILATTYAKSVAVLLLITGAAKLVSAGQKITVLALRDPLMGFLTSRSIIIMAGSMEIALALYILMSASIVRHLTLIAWLSVLFAAYHVGLALIGFHGVCPCLGNANAWLHISDSTISLVTIDLLIYFLVGSVVMLGIGALCNLSCQRQTPY